MDLAKRQCVPCRGDTPRLAGEDLAKLLRQLGSDWELAGPAGPGEPPPAQGPGGNRLRKTYRFRDFATALAFVNRIGAIAEREQHHPDIALAWGRVSVEIWTHAIGGLSENDFILAAKIDEIAG